MQIYKYEIFSMSTVWKIRNWKKRRKKKFKLSDIWNSNSSDNEKETQLIWTEHYKQLLTILVHISREPNGKVTHKTYNTEQIVHERITA